MRRLTAKGGGGALRNRTTFFIVVHSTTKLSEHPVLYSDNINNIYCITLNLKPMFQEKNLLWYKYEKKKHVIFHQGNNPKHPAKVTKQFSNACKI